MRANLKHGKLIPPASLADAIERKKQINHEVKRIDAQIADPARVMKYSDTAAYDKWCARARRVKQLFACEERQLDEFIVLRQSSVETLLKDAYELLKDLELDFEFEPKEQALMVRLDKHFEATDAKKEATG